MVLLPRAHRRRDGSPASRAVSILIALVVVVSVTYSADAHDGFAVGERVGLYVNKLGPFVLTFAQPSLLLASQLPPSLTVLARSHPHQIQQPSGDVLLLLASVLSSF